jgi:hypothetical protein
MVYSLEARLCSNQTNILNIHVPKLNYFSRKKMIYSLDDSLYSNQSNILNTQVSELNYFSRNTRCLLSRR